MILQALAQYYDILLSLGKIPRPGWSRTKVAYALYITADGRLEQVVCLKEEKKLQIKNEKWADKKEKTILVAPEHELPAPAERSVNITANFLWDNSSYILGIDGKDNPQRTLKCFKACRELHQELLSGSDGPTARALLAFFRNWEPEKAAENPALADCLEDISAGGNIVFRFEGRYVHEDPKIIAAWDRRYSALEEGPQMICLITGEKEPAQKIHPSIKGVRGAQSSGASLVSFNAPAFCSYGREQNFNAPVGKHAAFAYTAALNHLLADRERVYHMGDDTTVMCWARNGDTAYGDFAGVSIFDGPSGYDAKDLVGMIKNLCKGKNVEFDGSMLDPGMEFYVLGLSPNASRLSVRFFLCNSFGGFLKNVQAHYRRMEMTRPVDDRFETLSVQKMLAETVNRYSKDKSPAPNLAGETLRAILSDSRYPAQLLQGVTLRVRAERYVTWGRAAIIKAYYLKNPHKNVPKEVLTVSLNPSSTNIPYTLGRLFSVLEAVQTAANPSINVTIKDRYFNSASATPAHVFPTLINLAQKHMKKLEGDSANYYDKRLAGLMEKLGETYPARLSLPEQGAFQLGYYHQTQARYNGSKNKEEKENA